MQALQTIVFSHAIFMGRLQFLRGNRASSFVVDCVETLEGETLGDRGRTAASWFKLEVSHIMAQKWSKLCREVRV